MTHSLVTMTLTPNASYLTRIPLDKRARVTLLLFPLTMATIADAHADARPQFLAGLVKSLEPGALTRLSLSGNDITDIGCIALAEASAVTHAFHMHSILPPFSTYRDPKWAVAHDALA